MDIDNNSSLQTYRGSSLFRFRVLSSFFSFNSIVIDEIRLNDDSPGICDFEANFLRLIDKLTSGTHIEINESGTRLLFRPGVIVGGNIEHDCGTQKSIGWFVEAILPLVLFAKAPTSLTLTGILPSESDLPVEVLKHATLPMLENFGIGSCSIDVLNYNSIILRSMPVLGLTSVDVTSNQQIDKIHGVCLYTTSRQLSSRFVNSVKSHLEDRFPSITTSISNIKLRTYRNSSQFYSLSLYTSSFLSASITSTPDQTPEELTPIVIDKLVQEIQTTNGIVDSRHQPIVCVFMALARGVSKVKFGLTLTFGAISTMRCIKEAFGIQFKVTEGADGIELACMGIGAKNVSRAVL